MNKDKGRRKKTKNVYTRKVGKGVEPVWEDDHGVERVEW